MSDTFRVSVTSPPDREKLVAEIWFGDEHVAEINQEKGELQIEIYARRSDEPWAFPHADYMEALSQARHRLVGPG